MEKFTNILWEDNIWASNRLRSHQKKVVTAGGDFIY